MAGDSKNLKDQTITGISWSAIAQMGNQGLRIFVFIILARLLSPKEFGTIGMVLAFSSYGNKLLNFGFGPALIKERNFDQEQWSSVFWFNLSAGILFFLLLLIFAPLLASFYGNSELIPVTYLIAFIYVFSSLNILHNSKLTKEFNFKAIALIEISSIIISAIIAVILALNNYGVWSLVWQQLSKVIIESIILWGIERWRPTFTFNLEKVKKIFGFSFNIFLMGTINHIANNIDKMIIGKLEGEKLLGYYERGFQLTITPVSNIGMIFTKVMFPAYSSIQNDLPRLSKIYLLTNQAVAIFTFPIMVVFLFFSQELTVILFGSQWIEMAYFIKIFSIIGILATINGLVASMLWSIGKTQLYMNLGIFRTVCRLVGLGIGIFWGAKGAAIGLMLGLLFNFFPSLYFSGKPLNLSLIVQIRNVIFPLICALGTFYLIYFAFQFLSLDLFKFYWCFLAIALCLLTHIIWMRFLGLNAFKYIQKIAVDKIPALAYILGQPSSV